MGEGVEEEEVLFLDGNECMCASMAKNAAMAGVGWPRTPDSLTLSMPAPFSCPGHCRLLRGRRKICAGRKWFWREREGVKVQNIGHGEREVALHATITLSHMTLLPGLRLRPATVGSASSARR